MSATQFRLSHGAAYAALTATMFCLALNHVVSRGVHETVPPVGLSFWRWVLACLVMLPFIWRGLASKWPIFKRDWKLFTGLGTLMVGGTTMFIVMLQFTLAINISVVGSMQPAMTVLLTWALLQHRLNVLQVFGVAVGFAGVVAMVARGSWATLMTLSFNPADVTALVAVLGLAVYSIFLRRLPEELNPVEALFGITMAGCIVILPVYALETILFKPMPLTATAFNAITVMALFGSLAGNLMWNMGNQTLGPNRASIMINLIPVFGVLMAITFLGEELRSYHVAGFIMISISVWLVLSDGIRLRAESAP